MTSPRIRGLVLCCLLSGMAGCFGEDSTLTLAARGLGFGDYQSQPYPRTRPEIEAFPYAQLGVRLPKYPPSIFVLTVLGPNKEETWASSDGVKLGIEAGRIVSMSGVEPAFEVRVVNDPLAELMAKGVNIAASVSYEREVAVRTGDGETNLDLRCELLAQADVQSISIVNLVREVRLFEERCESDRGATTSRYWVSLDRPYVWSSVQQPAPGVPPVRLDMLKRPG